MRSIPGCEIVTLPAIDTSKVGPVYGALASTLLNCPHANFVNFKYLRNGSYIPEMPGEDDYASRDYNPLKQLSEARVAVRGLNLSNPEGVNIVRTDGTEYKSTLLVKEARYQNNNELFGYKITDFDGNVIVTQDIIPIPSSIDGKEGVFPPNADAGGTFDYGVSHLFGDQLLGMIGNMARDRGVKTDKGILGVRYDNFSSSKKGPYKDRALSEIQKKAAGLLTESLKLEPV